MIRYQAFELDSHGNVVGGGTTELELRTFHKVFDRVNVKGTTYKIIRVDGWCYNGNVVTA